jgi:Transposase IS66 family
VPAPSPSPPIPSQADSQRAVRHCISVWVEILLDKYFSYRRTERLLASWRLLGLDLAPGPGTDGLQRLEVLLRPIYEALKERNSRGDLHQGDETRLRVFVALEGKEEYAGGCGSCRVWTR